MLRRMHPCPALNTEYHQSMVIRSQLPHDWLREAQQSAASTITDDAHSWIAVACNNLGYVGRRGSGCATVEEHMAQLRKLGAPAAAAALGVAAHLAQLAESQLLRAGQRDGVMRLLMFLTVSEVSLLTCTQDTDGTCALPQLFRARMCSACLTAL